MSMMIELRALKGVSIAMSNDATRAYLVGVMVCPHTKENAGELYDNEREGAALLVATDGHRMAVGLGMPYDAVGFENKMPNGVVVEAHTTADWEQVIIPADMVKNILRVKVDKKYRGFMGSEFIWLHKDGERLRAVFYDGQVVTGAAVDGTFPDWKRVFTPCLSYIDAPSCANGMGFSGGFLSDLDTFGRCFGHEKVGGVKMYGHPDSSTSPVLFVSSSPDKHKGYYVLMPMRL